MVYMQQVPVDKPCTSWNNPRLLRHFSVIRKLDNQPYPTGEPQICLVMLCCDRHGQHQEGGRHHDMLCTELYDTLVCVLPHHVLSCSAICRDPCSTWCHACTSIWAPTASQQLPIRYLQEMCAASSCPHDAMQRRVTCSMSYPSSRVMSVLLSCHVEQAGGCSQVSRMRPWQCPCRV